MRLCIERDLEHFLVHREVSVTKVGLLKQICT